MGFVPYLDFVSLALVMHEHDHPDVAGCEAVVGEIARQHDFVEFIDQVRVSFVGLLGFIGVEPAFELRSCDRRLPAPSGNHLPKLVTEAKPDLFLVEVREPDADRDRTTGSGDEHAVVLRIADTRVECGLLDSHGLHRISSVVRCGGLWRIAWMVTTRNSVSTS